jgi:acetyl coenzyme A synthetase (ADP forming)-like protein
MTTTAVSYPIERESHVALRDGTVARVRPIRATDEPKLLEFLRSLPDEDRRMRFFTLSNDLSRTAHEQAVVDYVHSLGLLAVAGPEERIVGHALYAPCGEDRAEVGFAIAPDYQGRGLATLLLGLLAEAAAAHGIHTFEAVVLPENRRMLAVLRESGFPLQSRYAWDTIDVSFPTSLAPDALAHFEQREERAASSALTRLLYPGSVAVVGASRKIGSVGEAVLRNLVGAGFPGPIYPINPATDTIQGLPAYPTVEDVPSDVDLAVIAVPAERVVACAEQCGRKNVRSLIVLSAGFNEVGPEGQQRQTELLRVCRAYGMRLIGPNCIGAINTDPAAPLNATFGPRMAPAGRIGLATQSGALGLAAIDFTAARRLGFSSVVSMGNKADISGNDLLGFWHHDPRTDVILLYLESFGNPRKFARLARAISRTKPIVALKSGRSAVGARATASHTGALLSASDVTVDALFRQAGVIRTDTLDEMLDVADLLVHQPLPGGRRVAIVTNVGGPAVMCADTLEARGLEVPPLSQATQARLRALLPPEAATVNPVDMLAAARADQYEAAVRIVAEDPGIDAVIAIFLPPLATRSEDVAPAIAAAAAGSKPLQAVFMVAEALPELGTRTDRRVPGYHMPEAAAIALAHAVTYAEWLTQPVEPALVFHDVQRDDASQFLADNVQRGGGWLEPADVRHLLGLYGVPMVEQQVVRTPSDAAEAADQLGGQVALKVIAPGVIHKTEAGGVRLYLNGGRPTLDAAKAMARMVRDATGQEPTGFVVQRMAPAGVEMIVGVVNDPHFGPTVACGAGGTLVELLHDVSVRLAPLTRSDAARMVRELRSYPLLDGYRGARKCAVAALEDVLLRVGALAEDHPQIIEIDCNPVIVSAAGALVVDARIRVAAATPPRPLGARR